LISLPAGSATNQNQSKTMNKQLEYIQQTAALYTDYSDFIGPVGPVQKKRIDASLQTNVESRIGFAFNHRAKQGEAAIELGFTTEFGNCQQIIGLSIEAAAALRDQLNAILG
jgi:hypothetical protein